MPNEQVLSDGLRPTPEDRRDKPLGALFTLPKPEELPLNFSLGVFSIKDQIKEGDTDFCSAYMADGMSELQEGVELWPKWGFAASKDLTGNPDDWGQDLRSAFKRLVKYGSVEKKDALKVQNSRLLSSYPADLIKKATLHKKQTYLEVGPTQGMDAFDAIRATIYRFRNEKRAVGVGVLFGWSLKDKILDKIPKGGTGHAMYVVGWQTINGTPYLEYVNSAGESAGDKGIHLVSREVVNHFVKLYEAFMVVDIAREDIDYMLDYGIKADDNWIKGLWKVITTIIRSPFFTNEEKNYLLDMTKEAVKKETEKIVNPRERLLAAAQAWLGKDASTTNLAPDDLACAESVSNIIQSSIIPGFPTCISTADLKKQLDKYCQRTLDIEPGYILISPTGTGNGNISNGHTGIFLTPDRIASNSSATGLWTDNYSLKEWINRYRVKGGMPLLVYKPI